MKSVTMFIPTYLCIETSLLSADIKVSDCVRLYEIQCNIYLRIYTMYTVLLGTKEH